MYECQHIKNIDIWLIMTVMEGTETLMWYWHLLWLKHHLSQETQQNHDSLREKTSKLWYRTSNESKGQWELRLGKPGGWMFGWAHTYTTGHFSSINSYKMETMLKEEENRHKMMCLLGPGWTVLVPSQPIMWRVAVCGVYLEEVLVSCNAYVRYWHPDIDSTSS